MAHTPSPPTRRANVARRKTSDFRRPGQWRICDTEGSGEQDAETDHNRMPSPVDDCNCLQTLGHFATHVIHDVNGPLGTAYSSVQMALRLARPFGSTQLNAALKRSALGVRQASQVINRLSFLTAEGVQKYGNCCARDVAHAAKSLMAGFATCHGCGLRLRCSTGGKQVLGDPLQLTLAVVNLTTRAIHDGATSIWIATTVIGSSIALKVQDNSTTSLVSSNRSLNRRARHDGSVTCVDSSVRAIVRRHSGMLEVKPRRSGGRTISITLPAINR